MEKKQDVNILGTTYEIIYCNEEEDASIRGCSGYFDMSVKQIGLADDILIESDGSFKDLKCYHDKVLRHEIIHAFFYESGLFNNSDYAVNEELVDWIAIQMPKLVKAMQDCEVL